MPKLATWLHARPWIWQCLSPLIEQGQVAPSAHHGRLTPPVSAYTYSCRQLSISKHYAGVDEGLAVARPRIAFNLRDEAAASAQQKLERVAGGGPHNIETHNGNLSKRKRPWKGNERVKKVATRIREAIREDRQCVDELHKARAASTTYRQARNRNWRALLQRRNTIEHAAAASAALAKYQMPPSDTATPSNQELLDEVDDIVEDQRKKSKAGDGDGKALQNVIPGTLRSQDLLTNKQLSQALETVKVDLGTDPDHLDRNLVGSGPSAIEFEDLPLSPLVHPRLIKARKKFLQTKPLPSKEKTEFEAQLVKNPYAQMLASEVRMCFLTGARLPRDFLTSFSIKMEASTSNLWMVPMDFEVEGREIPYLSASGSEPSPLDLKFATPFISGNEIEQLPPLASASPLQYGPELADTSELESTPSADGTDAPQRLQTASPTSSDTSSSGDMSTEASVVQPGAGLAGSVDVTHAMGYAVASLPALRCLSGLGKRLGRVLPVRWKQELKRATQEVIVRENMSEFVLTLMRRKTARHLAWLQHCKKHVVEPWRGEVTEVKTQSGKMRLRATDPGNKRGVGGNASEIGISQAAAVLWFGNSYGDKGTSAFRFWGDENSKVIEDRLPLLYGGTGEDGLARSVPIYDMQLLLSELEYNWLRALSWGHGEEAGKSMYANRAVVIKSKPMAGPGLTWLWRLSNLATTHNPNRT